MPARSPPPARPPPSPAEPPAPADSQAGAIFESDTRPVAPSDPGPGRDRLSRWMGWRLRLLVGAALLGCLGLFLLAGWLGDAPRLDARWQAGRGGRIDLATAPLPALAGQAGKTLRSAGGASVDALALERSGRWLTDDGLRERQARMRRALAAAVAAPPVTLVFADGSSVDVQPVRPGIGGLGIVFWLLGGLAVALYLAAMTAVLARPHPRNLLYAAMALAQAANLAFGAVESTLALGLPLPLPPWEAPVRLLLDLLAGAALVHAAALHPRRLPHGGVIAAWAWGAAAALGALVAAGKLDGAWAWTQAAVALCCGVAILLLGWSHRLQPHPFAVLLRRFVAVVLVVWLLLTLALAGADRGNGVQQQLAAVGPAAWSVFVAALLLLVPVLSKPQPVLREFALLAAVSAVATSLDLLFVAVFSLGRFTSLTLSLFFALGVYAGTRQWLLDQLRGSNMLSAERMFAQLYRTAREIEARPERTPALLAKLLQDLFEPIELAIVARRPARATASGDGSTLWVPVPDLTPQAAGERAACGALALRFAQRGRRLFTREDARFTDAVVDQLRRALAFERAVEQGRHEERLRLAQDLHDDIGARLLTLMYRAPSPDIEDYLRHTLQDLKTLTRGLSASTHRLDDAAAEWKVDLTQRLAAAGVELAWSVHRDRDVALTVVQWSALTRVLRELVSNVMAHAGARHVAIELRLAGDRLDLAVTDDGSGRDPAAWSHGLGLGGVRKRVRQLGGEVEWTEAEPAGIHCRMTVQPF